MDLSIKVEIIGGPFDGSYRFDAANPFPEGLVFPDAFGPTAYLLSVSAPVGGAIELNSPQTTQAMLKPGEAECAGDRHFVHTYRVLSRGARLWGDEVRLVLKHDGARASVGEHPASVQHGWIERVAVYLQLSGH